MQLNQRVKRVFYGINIDKNQMVQHRASIGPKSNTDCPRDVLHFPVGIALYCRSFQVMGRTVFGENTAGDAILASMIGWRRMPLHM
jgi:hypothetical protein